MTKKGVYLRDGREPIPDSENVSRSMSSNRGKNTKPELIFRKALYAHKLIGYRLHYKPIIGRPDVCYTRKKVAIFINGCFWHRCPYCNPPFPKTHQEYWKDKFEKNINRDKKTYQVLINNGWKVVILWECRIKDDPENCVHQVEQVLKPHNKGKETNIEGG
jgi:DNA mismatch endonuclease, patch repair protein